MVIAASARNEQGEMLPGISSVLTDYTFFQLLEGPELQVKTILSADLSG